MEVKNCKDCGRLFNYISGPRICPACKDALESKFQAVKEYIDDNKNATLTDISEVNEVSVQQLKQWVREERLCFTEDSAVGIECESCGAMIKTGKYCEKCKKEMANNFGNIYRKETPSEAKKDARERARMRFFDN